MKKGFGFAVQTKWKVQELEKVYGIKSDKIVYWPNGTDTEEFNILISSTEAKNKLGLPKDKRIVLYTGHLFNWKGVDSLIKSIEFLPDDTLVYIVGGSPNDASNCKKNIREADSMKIVFISFVPHQQIPVWLKSADVLVLPNTGKQRVSLYYTSPMKLFEYMASGRPIVSSAVPSIMEILNETNSILVEPDNPKALAYGIKQVLDDDILAHKISSNSFSESKKYTWPVRARKILDYFEKHA
jgi:glycosyltransferase involved in cell wall biosynthesis